MGHLSTHCRLVKSEVSAGLGAPRTPRARVVKIRRVRKNMVDFAILGITEV